MGKLFGTDGVRGIVDKDLTKDLAYKVGSSVCRVIKEKENKKELTFLIGSDTRISKDMLTEAVSKGVTEEGCNIIDVGVMPTPAISYLVKEYKLDGAFIISASHNPSEYNGIKVLDGEGFKISEDIEDLCEKIILGEFKKNTSINNNGFYNKKDAKDDYIKFLIGTSDVNLDGYNIIIDTANGAASMTASDLFYNLGVNATFINDKPDGLNINDNAGSTHIERLVEELKKGKYDMGAAYDGDADRVILVDETGNIIDGDFVLAIIGNYLKKHGELKNNTIVGTVMSNLGLVKYCDQNKIDFVKTKVGDKYVLDNMLLNDYIIGGEQSGHIIYRKYLSTGDGQLITVQILNIMKKEKKSLKELSKVMQKYPQVLINLEATKEEKEIYENSIAIKDEIKKYEELLNDDGRILVRPSGTENLIRVMIEGKDIKNITMMCEELVSFISSEIKSKKKIKKKV